MHVLGQATDHRFIGLTNAAQQLGGEVAIKEIEKAGFPRPVSEYFAEAKAMFKAEHPNVVAIRQASQSATHICLSMPYYKNGSLADKLYNAPLPLSEVQRVGQDILAGLEAIHVAGSIHFDVKPSNVLFSDCNRAMVADFGQACPIGPNGLSVVPNMYRFAIPPEFFTGIGSVRSDVYQAGLTLYRAVNGDRFFQDQRAKNLTDAQLQDAITTGRLPNRQKFMPHVPRRLRTVIRKAMSVVPADRYGSASEFAVALGAAGVGHNWTTIISSDRIVWRAERKNKNPLVVTAVKNGVSWDVSIHSIGIVTRSTEPSLWRSGITYAKAMEHLKTVFQSLG